LTPETRQRIKRGLGPLLPVVQKVLHGGRTLWNSRAVLSIRIAAGRAGYAVPAAIRIARRRPKPPLRALRRYEFDALVQRAPYYRSRWDYLSSAGRIANALIARHGLRTALELGPHLRPVIVGSDAMDRLSQAELQSEGRVFVHDATTIPWPFDDKQYDVFVALQVFEHLGDQQAAVFREVRRIAKHAEISVPIDWVMDDPLNCHHRISNEMALSWFAPVVPTRIAVGNGGRRTRLIYVFENLEA
jgi:SAM-dependent methyltransferase